MQIRPASWDDFEQVVALLQEQRRAGTGIAQVRAEFVRGEWELPGFEVGRDNLVAENGGELVGYAAVSAAQGLTLVAPDAALADELLARIVARARERDLGHLSLTVASPTDPEAALLGRHPFMLEAEPIRMWRRLDSGLEAPRWPEGVTVRTFEPADALPVHTLLDEAYGAWDTHYVPMPHDDWVRWMTGDIEFDPTVWWLAERDGELAGCALHWSGGWLKDLAVRTAERGRGLGAALVRQGLVEFARRGVRRVGLKVDAGNPTGAIELYERLGFVSESREAIWALSL